MDESGGGYCPRCGKAVKGGASFCTGCGEPLGTRGGPPGEQAGGAAGVSGTGAEQVAGGAAAPVPPPGGPPYPAPGVPPYGGEVAPTAPAAFPRRSRVPLVLGILGGILVLGAVAVLVLWLTLWRGAGGTGDPISLAEKFISAMEKGDADAYLDCFDPESLSMEDNPFLDAMDMKKLVEMTFSMSEISFQGVQLEKESESGDRAEVVTTAGTLTLSVMGFEEEYDLAEEPLRFKMVKKSGRWYLTEDPMPGSVGPEMDLEDMEDMDFEDMDLEELEEFLPEDLDLEELENMSPDELLEFLEELERLMEDLPSEETST